MALPISSTLTYYHTQDSHLVDIIGIRTRAIVYRDSPHFQDPLRFEKGYAAYHISTIFYIVLFKINEFFELEILMELKKANRHFSTILIEITLRVSNKIGIQNNLTPSSTKIYILRNIYLILTLYFKWSRGTRNPSDSQRDSRHKTAHQSVHPKYRSAPCASAAASAD